MNNKYRGHLENAGLIVSGQSPDGTLVEKIELSEHPWFVGGQFHPELKSTPRSPHPLFREFIRRREAMAVKSWRGSTLIFILPPGRAG